MKRNTQFANWKEGVCVCVCVCIMKLVLLALQLGMLETCSILIFMYHSDILLSLLQQMCSSLPNALNVNVCVGMQCVFDSD